MGDDIVRALCEEAKLYASTAPSLETAMALAASLEGDEEAQVERFYEAWRHTNAADQEGTPLHLVSAVRARLVLRVHALFLKELEAARTTLPQPARREAFTRTRDLGKAYERFIEDEWARSLRMFRPWMQTVELETETETETETEAGPPVGDA